tara:strand:- start:1751 stop:2044 length:294 start_codon:yes stop_codon:yes gene_type:complete
MIAKRWPFNCEECQGDIQMGDEPCHVCSYDGGVVRGTPYEADAHSVCTALEQMLANGFNKIPFVVTELLSQTLRKARLVKCNGCGEWRYACACDGRV